MKIIILKTTHGLGNKWDIKNVPDGYARNFLLPKGIAAPAIPEMLARAEQEKAKVLYTEERMKEEIKELAEKMKGLVLHMRSKSDETGKLFGSIGAQKIVDALAKEKKINLPLDLLQLKRPIKKIGEHEISLALERGRENKLRIIVEKE